MNIDLRENNDNDVLTVKIKPEVPIKLEYNGHLKTEVIITIPIMAHMNITNHVNV